MKLAYAVGTCMAIILMIAYVACWPYPKTYDCICHGIEVISSETSFR